MTPEDQRSILSSVIVEAIERRNDRFFYDADLDPSFSDISWSLGLDPDVVRERLAAREVICTQEQWQLAYWGLDGWTVDDVQTATGETWTSWAVHPVLRPVPTTIENLIPPKPPAYREEPLAIPRKSARVAPETEEELLREIKLMEEDLS